MPLEEYKDLIGSLAGIFTIVQLLSPVFICKNFIKQGSTDNYDIKPFLGGFVLSGLFMEHAIIIGDNIMLYINVLGLFLSLIYLLLFFMYTKDKSKLNVPVLVALAVLSVATAYATQENKDVVEFRFGTFLTGLLFYIIAMPLFSIKTIYSTKNTDMLPMPLIYCGTIMALLWFLYGVAINNNIVIFQNFLVFVLNASQVILYLICVYQKSKMKQE